MKTPSAVRYSRPSLRGSSPLLVRHSRERHAPHRRRRRRAASGSRRAAPAFKMAALRRAARGRNGGRYGGRQAPLTSLASAAAPSAAAGAVRALGAGPTEGSNAVSVVIYRTTRDNAHGLRRLPEVSLPALKMARHPSAWLPDVASPRLREPEAFACSGTT